VAGLQGHGNKPRISWKITRPENWQNAWKRFIKPSRIGKTFWVTPPWLTPPKFRHRQVITIEPGMAFGTGTHATTRGCLEFLELASSALPKGTFTALDVGTGSGILAIALAKSGARKVWAIDDDPVALDVAGKNLQSNGAADCIYLAGTRLSSIKRTFSIVVANLTAETIIELADVIKKRVAPKGFLILSGILHPKANAVVRRFAGIFRIVKRKRSREWVTLLLRRN
jgi:ribosomal protein L11 methyltransferase